MGHNGKRKTDPFSIPGVRPKFPRPPRLLVLDGKRRFRKYKPIRRRNRERDHDQR